MPGTSCTDNIHSKTFFAKRSYFYLIVLTFYLRTCIFIYRKQDGAGSKQTPKPGPQERWEQGEDPDRASAKEAENLTTPHTTKGKPSMTQHRVRRAGHHRGWTARQMTPEAIARDIAASIRQSNGSRTVTQYTTDPAIIEKVEELLAQ
jgi:hypothetical protein